MVPITINKPQYADDYVSYITLTIIYSKSSDFVAWRCGPLLSTVPQGATTPRNKV